MLLKASAPGSLMLLGEYAVLHDKAALVCAIDKRMTVSLAPRADKKIFLRSALGEHTTDLSLLEIVAPFQFVLAALKAFKKFLRHGCEITIESEFSSTVGFASSAAVTVATVAVLAEWLNLNFTKTDLIRHARRIVRTVQGLGSGADVAACVLGGVVAYRARPLEAVQLPYTCPLTVVYSGHKTPTVTAVNLVKQKFSQQPMLFQSLMQSIHHCALDGKHAVTQQDWRKLGEIFNIQQGMMDALGVNTEVLGSIVTALRDQPGVQGAKISGSGLGDCVVALGALQDHQALSLPANASVIPVNMTQQGVYCEKN